MSIDEFIERLAAFTKERKPAWSTVEGGGIRAGECCPITVFGGTPAHFVCRAATALGMDYPSQYAIVEAADKLPCHNAQLRARILDACGLTEVSP